MTRMPMIAAAAATAFTLAPAAAADPYSTNVETLIGALDSCTQATVELPHMFMRGFVVLHIVDGQSADGSCLYAQTMPGDMMMDCALSPGGRQAMIDEWRGVLALAEGDVISTSDAAPAWSGDCVVVMPGGQEIPFGETMRVR